MAARYEEAAAAGPAGSARFPLREIATIIGVVFAAATTLIVGMQWAISNNVGPLFLAMQGLESQVASIHEDVDVLRVDVVVLRGEATELRGEVTGIRAEVAENRAQIADLRERVARVETGLQQVRANQVRMLEILERGPHPRG